MIDDLSIERIIGSSDDQVIIDAMNHCVDHRTIGPILNRCIDDPLMRSMLKSSIIDA
jgi:hypothetical protein